MAMEGPKPSKSKTVVALIVGLGVFSAAVYIFNPQIYRFFYELSQGIGIHSILYIFIFLSCLYAAAVWLVFKNLALIGQSKFLILVIIVLGLIFRMTLIASEPEVLSKDMYRYVWDGRLQQSGINPYLHPPNAAALAELRDDRIYPNINRKNYTTIYPAAAQLFFRLFHSLVGDRYYGFKALMVVCEVLAIILFMAMMMVYNVEPARIIVYAWHPLPIFEIAYSGHLEGLTLLFLAAALYLNAIDKKHLGLTALAVCASTKLYPALLLPAFLNRGQRIKGIIFFVFIFFILYLPFLTAGRKISGFLPIYLQNPYESFNLGLKYLIMYLFSDVDYFFLSKLFLIIPLFAGVYILFKPKDNDRTVRYCYILLGLFLIFIPASLHPWYVIPLIPFLAFYPSTAWLLFTCTVMLSYLKYVAPDGIMPAWILIVEYLPLFALLTAGYVYKKATSGEFRFQMSKIGYTNIYDKLRNDLKS